MVSFLDSGNNIIETKIMSEGSIGQAPVYPREILKYALACDCNSIILAHNHPGGSQNFSMEDKALTQRIVDIFNHLGLRFWITLLLPVQAILPWQRKAYFLISVKMQQIMMLLYWMGQL
jgi:DNA repair protein RadC